jgi:hypothetical protein
MAFEQRSLDDYIDVAQRIADFREKYPEGTLAPWDHDQPFRFMQAMGYEKNGDTVMQSFVVVVAAAYRHPGDIDPGVGMAWEIFPGRTPYTRGSELQNAETSAWGRAIIAVGASDSKRGVASREEVRNRQAEHDDHSHQIVTPDGKIAYPYCTACGGSAKRLIEQARAMRRQPPEVDADGAATVAEQTRMMTGPEPGIERFKAGDVPVDDRWTTDAPSWAVGVDPPEDQPGSILPAQRSQIMAVYTALGIKDRDKRLKDIAEVLWPGSLFAAESFASTNDLSHKQAAALLENLHERHSGKMTRR